jgi:hypothetical protein
MHMLDKMSVPIKKIDFRIRKIGGKQLLINRYDAYEISEVAVEILKISDGNHTIHEIIDILSEIYNVKKETLDSDCIHFLTELAELGVISFRDNK